MKLSNILIVLAASVSSAHCNEVAYPAMFTVKVTDEEGLPVENAKVLGRTFLSWEPGPGDGKINTDRRFVSTNEEGLAVFDYPSKQGYFSISIGKTDGYYKTSGFDYQFEKLEGLKWKPENPIIPYVLKKKKNPIPLYAKAMWISGSYKEFPALNQFIGFDFEHGDWVEPYGKGQIEDLSIQLSREYADVYNHDCTVSIRFPNQHDGFVIVPKSLEGGSELRLDYLAPEKGYRNEILKKSLIRKNKEIINKNAIDYESNYFLRIRSKEDEEGKMIGAHYAKVHGDFLFDVINSKTGLLGFDYYFNPTLNDRNLEFDSAKNLFPKERVNKP